MRASAGGFGRDCATTADGAGVERLTTKSVLIGLLLSRAAGSRSGFRTSVLSFYQGKRNEESTDSSEYRDRWSRKCPCTTSYKCSREAGQYGFLKSYFADCYRISDKSNRCSEESAIQKAQPN